MTDYFDPLETRPPAEREASLVAALPWLIGFAKDNSLANARVFADVDPSTVTSREALAKLPVTRKYELLEQQQLHRATDVFGGFATVRYGAGMPRIFASPGTLYEPEGHRQDYWRAARALFAAHADEIDAGRIRSLLVDGRHSLDEMVTCLGTAVTRPEAPLRRTVQTVRVADRVRNDPSTEW